MPIELTTYYNKEIKHNKTLHLTAIPLVLHSDR